MKAIICGAGIAGLSAALFLTQKGWEIELIEKAVGLRAAGYVVDFFGSGYDAAERAGILPALSAKKVPVTFVSYVNEDDKVRSAIDYENFAASLDGRLMGLARGDIERVLHDALAKNIRIHYGTTIAEIDNRADGVTVRLENGESLSGDLLIGADGIHSQVREMVFGPEQQFIRFLGYHTAAYVVDDPRLNAELDGAFRILTVPDRQVGVYDAGEAGLTVFYAHRAATEARPADKVAALRAAYGDLGWHVPALLDAAENCDDVYYDTISQIEMQRWHLKRCVLLGDAAYAVSLLAGQGASLAMGGAYILSDLIGSGEIDAGLASFTGTMMDDVRKKQAAGRKTADWFVPPTAFHNTVRDLFLNATRLPGLKFLLNRFFAPSIKSLIH